MKKINETLSISELINSSVFSTMLKGFKVNRIVKHSTIFSFWSDVVGVKFAKFTKPTAIKGSKLYVSAKNPVLVQELSLNKTKIIKKVNTYSMPLGIKILDIVLDYKNYKSEDEKEQILETEDKPAAIKEAELDNVIIDENTKETLRKNIFNIKFLDEKQKENFYKKLLVNEKVKKIRKSN